MSEEQEDHSEWFKEGAEEAPVARPKKTPAEAVQANLDNARAQIRLAAKRLFEADMDAHLPEAQKLIQSVNALREKMK